MNDFLEEGIVEIIELLDHTVSCSLKLENELILHETFDECSYKDIVRNLHSIKGASGMLGINDLMEFIHELETGVISLKNQNKINAQFMDQFIRYLHLVVDYLEGDNRPLKSIANVSLLFEQKVEPNVDDEDITAKRELKNIKGTSVAIERLKKFGQEYLATPDDHKPSVIHIHSKNDDHLKSIVDQTISKSIVYHYNNINDIYTNSFIFKYNQFFLINLDDLKTNPFFLQKICSIFKKNIEFIYYSQNERVLDAYLDGMREEKFKFHFHEKLDDALDVINQKVNHLTTF